MIVDEADKLFEEGQEGFRDQVKFNFKLKNLITISVLKCKKLKH